MENIQAIAALIGVVNGVRLLFDDPDPKHKSFIYFILAVVAGVVFGALHWFGLSIESGFVAALASSGVYQVAKKVGGI